MLVPKNIASCVAALSAICLVAMSSIDAMAHERATIVLTGTGVVTAEPDMAIVSIGTVTENRDAGQALYDNNIKTQAVLNALINEGVREVDIQTRDFSIQPNIVYPNSSSNGANEGPRIVGYTVRNSVEVKLRNLNLIGQVLNQAINLGANDVSGPHFAVADPSMLQEEARISAVRDAMEKAEVYTDAAKVQLGSIISIQEGSVGAPQPDRMMMAREASAAVVPISGGEISFSSDVTIRWEITD